MPKVSISQSPSEPVLASERLLSDDLSELRERATVELLTLAQLEESLRGRGFAVLIILIALPFMIPVSIPGMSAPFGLLLAFMGLRVAIGKRPWLPQWFLRRTLSRELLTKVLGFGVRLALWMERVARPRMNFLHKWPGMVNFIGFCIMMNGLLLILPPPAINTLPAAAIILLTIGMMERDGVIVLWGYAVSALSFGYIALLTVVGKLGFEGISKFFNS